MEGQSTRVHRGSQQQQELTPTAAPMPPSSASTEGTANTESPYLTRPRGPAPVRPTHRRGGSGFGDWGPRGECVTQTSVLWADEEVLGWGRGRRHNTGMCSDGRFHQVRFTTKMANSRSPNTWGAPALNTGSTPVLQTQGLLVGH